MTLRNIDGVFCATRENRTPTRPECLTCTAVTGCEVARMRVEIYKAAIMLENARQDIQQLEARVLLLSSRSAIRTAIQLGLLILITTFAFSGSLPDIPRRTGRSRRETDTLL